MNSNTKAMLAVGAVAVVAVVVSSQNPKPVQKPVIPSTNYLTLDDLIFAIGHAEGWGVKPSGTTWVMVKHDAKTIAPFGLIYDVQKYPMLLTDAPLVRDFVIGKLTGIVKPRVASIGVTGFSATVILGLIRPNGALDESKLPELAKKWAPIGAKNDPDNLNKNWLPNVRLWLKKAADA